MIALPTFPAPASAAWELVDFGGTMSSTLGGSSQRVNRLGGRWKLAVAMPVLTDKQAREWAAAMAKGLRQGVTMKAPQPGLYTGSPGAPLVAGALQAGSTINLDGFTPGYVCRAGQWLSIKTGGQGFLYQIAGDVMADASGLASVPIEPALRVSPSDNDAVELGLPMIEGLLEGVPGWSIDVDRLTRGFSFTIVEAR